VFSLAILDEVYVNKKLASGASGPPANPSDRVIRAGCKLQIANWSRHFLQPLIFFFLFLSRKKEKRLISSDLRKDGG
jgi:hypothetical protein